MTIPKTIYEPARDIPIVHDCDVCVVGGSCTGVFAAVRAARLGARVAIVEKTNCFGGAATNALVNVWHSLLDTVYQQPIIAGLTLEVIERLEKRQAVTRFERNADSAFRLNTEELKVELDELVRESRIYPLLHTTCCALDMEDQRVGAAFIENKSGRGALMAKVFVDATGDGDLAAYAGLSHTVDRDLQPPTTCSKIRNFQHPDFNYRQCYEAHREEFGLPLDSGWFGMIPGLLDHSMVAENHIFDVNCIDADQLTRAEMTGRQLTRGQMDMIRKYGPQGRDIALTTLASSIGIRETRRFDAEYTLTEEDVLWGKRFNDAIANGSYRVDVHYAEGGGFLFKYLDGTTCSIGPGGSVPGRWRDEITQNPTFYQIPYRTMVHHQRDNLIMAGRMIATDRGAFGATRVMVNLNQVGEAAGTAAVLAIQGNHSVADVSAPELRRTLADGGSIIL